jgi:2'-5' RNA ligase
MPDELYDFSRLPSQRAQEGGGAAPFDFSTLPSQREVAAKPSRYDSLIEKHARSNGLDPDLLRSVITPESHDNAVAVSPKGAQGLMQLMPATAARFGVSNPFDPDQNIGGGAKYLRWLLDRYHGDVALALAGYNAGEGNVDKYKGVPPFAETRAYVRGITSKYRGRGYAEDNDRFDFSKLPSQQSAPAPPTQSNEFDFSQLPSQQQASPPPAQPVQASKPATPPQTQLPQPASTPNAEQAAGGRPAAEQFPRLNQPGYSDALADLIKRHGPIEDPSQLASYTEWLDRASKFGDLSDPKFRAAVVAGSYPVPADKSPERWGELPATPEEQERAGEQATESKLVAGFAAQREREKIAAQQRRVAALRRREAELRARAQTAKNQKDYIPGLEPDTLASIGQGRGFTFDESASAPGFNFNRTRGMPGEADYVAREQAAARFRGQLSRVADLRRAAEAELQKLVSPASERARAEEAARRVAESERFRQSITGGAEAGENQRVTASAEFTPAAPPPVSADPDLDPAGAGLSRAAFDEQEAKPRRAAEAREEQERIAASLTPEERRQISVNARGELSMPAGVSATLGHFTASFVGGLEGLTAGVFRTVEDLANSNRLTGADPATGVDPHGVSEFLKKQAYMTQASLAEAEAKRPLSTTQKVFSWGADQLGGAALLVGASEVFGPDVAFAGTGFFGAKGRGAGYGEATVEAVKGYAFSKLFSATEGRPLKERVPLIFAGSFGVERLTGEDNRTALKSAATNTLFVALPELAMRAAPEVRSYIFNLVDRANLKEPFVVQSEDGRFLYMEPTGDKANPIAVREVNKAEADILRERTGQMGPRSVAHKIPAEDFDALLEGFGGNLGKSRRLDSSEPGTTTEPEIEPQVSGAGAAAAKPGGGPGAPPAAPAPEPASGGQESAVGVRTPVPESAETLGAQFKSALDQKSPRVAVLVTKGAPQPKRTPAGFVRLNLSDGDLFVSDSKARRLGLDTPQKISDFITHNGYESLIGKGAPVSDTSRGAALRTENAAGKELSTSIVPTPADAQAQATVDREQFPEAARQEVMPAQVAAARRVEEQRDVRPQTSPTSPSRPGGTDLGAGSGGQAGGAPGRSEGGLRSTDEELYARAVAIVRATGRGSTAVLQRALKVDYGKAVSLIDRMEREGVVGPHREGKAREVLAASAQPGGTQARPSVPEPPAVEGEKDAPARTTIPSPEAPSLSPGVPAASEQPAASQAVEASPEAEAPPQTQPPREYQHSDFGRVVEAENQRGVGEGRLRVVDDAGGEHVILKPGARGRGNERAVPLKRQGIVIRPREDVARFPASNESENQATSEGASETANKISSNQAESSEAGNNITGVRGDAPASPEAADSYRHKSTGQVSEVRKATDKTVFLGERGGKGKAAPVSAEDFASQYEKTEHKFSSTQVDLPPSVAREVRALGQKLIPDLALYTDPEDPSYGREENPHVTVKYGLHDETPEKVRALLRREPPVTVTLGKTSTFPAKNDAPCDVVKIDVGSKDLRRLNKAVGEGVKVTDTHPEYVPHVTLAYVKKGLGEKFAGDSSLAGRRVTIGSVTFSSSNGETTDIPLGGNSEAAAATTELEQPTAAEARQSVKTEKVNARTGLTPTQTDYLAGELEQVADKAIEEQTGEDGPAGEEFRKKWAEEGGIPARSHGHAFDFKLPEPETIKVPGDGEFTVASAQAANRLHQKITGKPIEGFERATGTGLAPGRNTVRLSPKEQEANTDVDSVVESYGGAQKAHDALLKVYRQLTADPEAAKQIGGDMNRMGELIRQLEGRAAREIKAGDTITWETDFDDAPLQSKVKAVEPHGYRVEQYSYKDARGKKRTSDFVSSDRDPIKTSDVGTGSEEPSTEAESLGDVAAKRAPERKIEDVGEKIGGARKDLWRERGLALSDLEGMTAGEQSKYVTKQNVWKPDYQKMVESGADPQAAALVKVIYDSLAAKPKKETPDERNRYLRMMTLVRDAYEGVKSVEDVKGARTVLLEDKLGWRGRDGWKDEDSRRTLFSVYKGRSEPFSVDYAAQRRAEKMVADGFPAQEPWTRRFEVTPSYSKSDGAFRVRERGTGKTVGYADSEDAAKGLARSAYERQKSDRAEGVLPERPHLENLAREGGRDVRLSRDVTGDDFLTDFGFRGVEFGNWAASDERQRLVNLAYDALHDLADVLRLPPKALSLNGTLGLAFGARGKGRAAAHYEPTRMVINVTKLNGAGSLAHEWGHALDHYFGELDRPDAYGGTARGASGWFETPSLPERPRKETVKVGDEYVTRDRVRLPNLRPEMRDAWDGVMRTIFQRTKGKAEAVREQELKVERGEAQIAKQKGRLEEARAKTPGDSAQKKFVKDLETWLSVAEPRLLRDKERLANLRGEPEPEGGYGKVESSYYQEAKALSGKSGSSGYWARPTELLARSFESYVFDRIRERGGQSDYLVHGVESDRYSKEKGFKGNPYPAGEERAAIDAAFDHLFDVMEAEPTEKGYALKMARPDDKSLEELQSKDFSELVPQASVTRDGHLLEVNAEGHEILRRAFEQNLINAGQREGEPEAAFDGTFLNSRQIADTARTLRAAAKEMLDKGYPSEEAAPLNEMARELAAAGRAGKGTAIAYVYDEAVPHEEFHRAGYAGAASEALASRHANFTGLAAHPAIQKAWDNYFSRVPGYSRLDESLLVEETAAWIAGGKAATLGLEDDEAADYLRNWLVSYAEKNGYQTLKNFAEVALPHVEKIISQIRGGRPDSSGEAAGVQSGGPGHPKQPGEVTGSSDAGRQEGTFGGAQEESEEVGTGRFRQRSLPSTLRAKGVAAADSLYEVYSNKSALADGARLLDTLGFDAAESLLKSGSQLGPEHMALGELMSRALLSHAEESGPELAATLRAREEALTSTMAAAATRAGQFIQAAQAVSHSAEDVTAAAEKIAKERGKPLTERESQLVRRAGTESERATTEVEAAAARASDARRSAEDDRETLARAEEGLLTKEEIERLRRRLSSLRDKERRREARVAELEGRTGQWRRSASAARRAPARAKAVEILEAGESDLEAQVRAALGQRPLKMARAERSLTPQTETPEFRRWFEGSKVVDDEGNPLVVYHGTPSATFEVFGRVGARDGGFLGEGFYFTADPKWAGTFAEARIQKGGASLFSTEKPKHEKAKAPAVLPVYLSIKNPLNLDSLTTTRLREFTNQARAERGLEPLSDERWDKYAKAIQPVLDAGNPLQVSKAVGDYLGSLSTMAGRAGYDGIIAKGIEGDTYLAFRPNQIKSATGNRGTFSPDNPSILKMARAEGDAGQPSSQSPAPLDDDTLTKLARLGALRLLRAPRGKYSVKDFKSDMLADFGPRVEPHLDRIHAEAVKVRRETLRAARREAEIERIAGREGIEGLSRAELEEIAEQEREQRRRAALVQAEHERAARAFESKDVEAAKKAEREAERKFKEEQREVKRIAREAGRAATREEKQRVRDAKKALDEAMRARERAEKKAALEDKEVRRERARAQSKAEALDKAESEERFRESRSFVRDIARKASRVSQRSVGGEDVGSKALAEAIGRHASTDEEALAAAKLARNLSPAEFARETGLTGKDLKDALVAGRRVLDAARADVLASKRTAAAQRHAAKTGEADLDEAIVDLHRARARKRDAERRVAQQLRRLTEGRLAPAARATASLARDGLLAAKGLLRIASGMTLKQAADAAARIPEGFVDEVVSRALGLPRVSGGQSLAGLVRAVAGLPRRGGRNALAAIKGESSELMHAHEPPTSNPYVNVAVSTMQRLYGAKEAVLRSFAYPEALHAEARVFAINDLRDKLITRSQLEERTLGYVRGTAKFTGARNSKIVEQIARQQAEYEMRSGEIGKGAVEARARTLAKKPEELIHALALQHTERQVYANPSYTSDAVKGTRQALSRIPGAGSVFDVAQAFVLPFVKRPANSVADALLTYTGAKIPVEIARGIRAKFDEGEWGANRRRAFNRAVARGGVGWALFGLGIALGAAGLMTPVDDDKDNLKGVKREAGYQDGALHAGGRYYRIGTIPFAGWLLAMGATYHAKGARAVPGALLKMISEHPLLRSLSELADTLSEVKQATGERGDRMRDKMAVGAARMGARLIPSPLAIFAEAADAREREQKTVGAPFLYRLPGARNTLPAQKTPFGREVEKSQWSFVDPTASTREHESHFTDELLRLKVGVGLPKKSPDEREESFKARSGEMMRAVEEAGTALVGSDEYMKSSDKERVALIRRTLAGVHALFPADETGSSDRGKALKSAERLDKAEKKQEEDPEVLRERARRRSEKAERKREAKYGDRLPVNVNP